MDWHWYFLAQPHDLPERVITAAPERYYFGGGRDDRFQSPTAKSPPRLHTYEENKM